MYISNFNPIYRENFSVIKKINSQKSNNQQINFGQKRDFDQIITNCTKKAFSCQVDRLSLGKKIIFEGPGQNFCTVEPGIFFKGPGPGKSEFKKLADKGIKVIINLKQEGSGAVKTNKNKAAKYGMEYYNIPFGHFENVTKKNFEKVDDVLKILNNSITAQKPVYLCCYDGKTRTGMLIAVYKIRKDHKG